MVQDDVNGVNNLGSFVANYGSSVQAANLQALKSLTVPVAPGAAPTADGSAAYDNTQLRYVAGSNGKAVSFPKVLCASNPASDTIALVGMVLEKAFATSCQIPASELVANKQIRLKVWFDVTSKTTSPKIFFKVRYGGTGTNGTLVYNNTTGSTQGADADREGYYDFMLGGTAAASGSATIIATGVVDYLPNNGLLNNLQSGIVTGQVTNLAENVWFTVSSNGGVGAGSQIQMLTLTAEGVN